MIVLKMPGFFEVNYEIKNEIDLEKKQKQTNTLAYTLSFLTSFFSICTPNSHTHIHTYIGKLTLKHDHITRSTFCQNFAFLTVNEYYF